MRSLPTTLLVASLALSLTDQCAGQHEAPQPAATADANDPASPPTGELWVAAYHPCYQWDALASDQVPWDRLTHLILGYLWPTQSAHGYTLGLPSGWSRGWETFSNDAKGYVRAGHEAGRKVTLMLGGSGSNEGRVWNRATAAAEVGGFAQSIVDLARPIGFDGVDLDWEDQVEHGNLVALARELRGRWPEAILTIPTSPMGDDAAKLQPAKEFVDAFMPMTYLSIPQWGGWLIPIPLTPLASAMRPGLGANPYSVDVVRKHWNDAGVPASKLVMGVAGFGAVWSDTQSDGVAPIAPYTSSLWGPADTEDGSSNSDNYVTWTWLHATLAANPRLEEGWDEIGQSSYWHAPAKNSLVSVAGDSGPRINVGLIFYESPRSVQAKVAYCRQHGMRGMMFWTLSQMLDHGSSPVLEAIRASTSARGQE